MTIFILQEWSYDIELLSCKFLGFQGFTQKNHPNFPNIQRNFYGQKITKMPKNAAYYVST